MNKVYWLTGDYFLDVDMGLIPFLKNKVDIEWTIVKTSGSKVEIKDDVLNNANIFTLHNRNFSIGIIKEYIILVRNINRAKPDILYSNFFGMPFFYPLLYLLLDKRITIIHAAHNVIPYKGWPNKRLMTKYVHYIFKGRALLHLFSKHLSSYIQKNYPAKRFFYAPLCIKDYGDVRTDNYNFDERKTKILFFGNVKDNKRLDLAIKSIKSLPVGLVNNIQFIIAGFCENKEKYLQLIDNHPSILPYFYRISDDNIPELFTKSDYLILPYEDVAQSGPLMIALNYNLPVIASDIDGFKEYIEEGITGFLFKNGNLESLSEVLIKACNIDKNDFNNMKQAIQRKVNTEYSLDAVSDRYLNFLRFQK